MANPRQRRKARSGSHRAVSHSRNAKKNLKKTPPIRGPPALQKAWNNRKTVRQNYESLGLVHNLNPTASGGSEHRLDAAPTEEEDTAMESIDAPTQPVASSSGSNSSVPKGHARIVRDDSGNVLRVEFAEGEDPDDQAEPESSAELAEAQIPQTAYQNWVSSLGNAPLGGKGGDVVQGKLGSPFSFTFLVLLHAHRTAKADKTCNSELEKISTLVNSDSKTTLSASISGVGARHVAQGEVRYLQRLVDKYGVGDIAAMARDAKANPEQRTEGQLRRALQRGGFL